MTIDRPEPRGSNAGKFARGAALLLALVGGWFATMAGVMAFTEIAPAALVIVDDVRRLGAIPADVRFVRSGRHVIVATSDVPGYVQKLYGAGAWLVLPALKSGCLDLTAVSKAMRVSAPPDIKTQNK